MGMCGEAVLLRGRTFCPLESQFLHQKSGLTWMILGPLLASKILMSVTMLGPHQIHLIINTCVGFHLNQWLPDFSKVGPIYSFIQQILLSTYYVLYIGTWTPALTNENPYSRGNYILVGKKPKLC